jgi:hypothetical protein
VDAHAPGGEAGHPVDGILEAQDLELADVAAEDAREGAVGPRVRHAAAGGVDRAGVGADHRRRPTHHGRDVLFAHREADHLDRAMVGDQEVEGRIDRLLAHDGGDLGHVLAFELLVAGDVGDDDVLPAALLLERSGLGADLGAGLRIQQAGDHLLGATLVSPLRHDGREAGRGGEVRILVSRDIDALAPGILHHHEAVDDPAPVPRVASLVVRDLHRQLRLAADLDRFGDRVEQAVGRVADVAHVDAVVAGDDLGQGDDLRRVGVGARRVDQAGGHAEGAGFHALGDQPLHRGQLVSSRLPAVVSHGTTADGPVADHRRDVEGRMAAVDRGHVVSHAAPGELEAAGEVGVHAFVAPADQGSGGRTALADDFGGHALADLALGARMLKDADVGVGMDVDEARSERLPLSVDHALCRRAAELADRLDAVSGHRDLAVRPGVAAAVMDAGVLDQQIIHADPSLTVILRSATSTVPG